MIHQLHQLIVLCLIAGALSYTVSWQTSKLAGVTILYFVCSALYLTFSPWSTWGELQFRVDTSSAQAALEWAGAVGICVLLFKQGQKAFYELIEAVMFLNNFAVLIFGFGIFNAYSVDSTMAAITFPIVLYNIINRKKTKRITVYSVIAITLPVIVSIKTGGTSFFYIFLAEFLVFSILRKEYRIAVIGAVILALTGFARLGEQAYFTNTSGRFETWKKTMVWWVDNVNWFVGSGTGSFWWLGSAIQDKKTGLLAFMHNDWLQILFEQGIIGLALMAALFVQAFRRTKKLHLRVTLAGISVAMLAQYPLRMMLGLVFVLFILFDSLEKEEFQHGEKSESKKNKKSKQEKSEKINGL